MIIFVLLKWEDPQNRLVKKKEEKQIARNQPVILKRIETLLIVKGLLNIIINAY